MDFSKLLSAFEGQPITHQILTSLLRQYKRPNDKIKALKDKGIIKSVKRGIYIPGENANMQLIHDILHALSHFEQEQIDHARFEDKILVPKLLELLK